MIYIPKIVSISVWHITSFEPIINFNNTNWHFSLAIFGQVCMTNKNHQTHKSQAQIVVGLQYTSVLTTNTSAVSKVYTVTYNF
jgi:hypothetical protein